MQDAIEFFSQGMNHLDNNELEHAVKAFTEAIKLDAELARAYNARAVAYAMLGNLGQAIANCDEAIRLDPEEHSFHQVRNLIWREAGRAEKAEANSDGCDSTLK